MGFRCRSVGIEGFWGLGVLGSCTDLGTQQPHSQQQDEARQPHSGGQGAVRSRAPLSPFPTGGAHNGAPTPLATPPPPKPRPLSPNPAPFPL